MKTIKDYTNPFQAILDFESAISAYTGAPYCVTTDYVNQISGSSRL